MLSIRPTTARPTCKILCHYFNSTDKMQLIRILDSSDDSWEKIVFPRQRVLFEATSEAWLEVYIEQKGRRVLREICYSYQIQAERSPS